MYARPDAIRRGSGDYALHIAKRLIEFYEDYFKVPYSLPKLGKNFLGYCVGKTPWKWNFLFMRVSETSRNIKIPRVLFLEKMRTENSFF